MATAFIGNLLVSNIKTVISASTATGQNNGAGGQNLLNPISLTTTLGSQNYTYQWSQTGTSITFSAGTSNSTNVTYSSTATGSTSIYCTVTDTWTGIKIISDTCVITWPGTATVPGTPTISTPSSGDKSFTITWSAPSSDGGSPITGYYVKNSTDGGANWSAPILVGVVTTYTWSGNGIISNGNTYVGVVAAVNSVGTGSYSGNSTPGQVPTFAAPTIGTPTLYSGYPTLADQYSRKFTVTYTPTNCVDYSRTELWILSWWESFGSYSIYTQTYNGGPGGSTAVTTTTPGTFTVWSVYCSNFSLGTQYYKVGAGEGQYTMFVRTYNNNNYYVDSSSVNYTPSGYVPSGTYSTSGYSANTGTFLVTGNTFSQISSYAIPDNDTNIQTLTVNAASSNAGVTICTSTRYFLVDWSGSTPSTYSQVSTGNQAPFTTNSGTAYRNLSVNVTDTGYDNSGDGKIRIRGGGTITTFSTTQRINVFITSVGETRAIIYM